MPPVSSNMTPLGSLAPDFELDNPEGVAHTLSDVEGPSGVAVVFMCNHCPFVRHVQTGMVQLARDLMTDGIGFVGINSNDVEQQPEDAPERMIEDAQRLGYPFPYLHDSTQDVARAYGAACTPDFFLFDSSRRLFYRGQMDDSRPSLDIAVTGADLRAAATAMLAGAAAPSLQKPSIGCGIKWRVDSQSESRD